MSPMARKFIVASILCFTLGGCSWMVAEAPEILNIAEIGLSAYEAQKATMPIQPTRPKIQTPSNSRFKAPKID